MTSTDYLVEMTFAPFANPLAPAEVASFLERSVQPTLQRLTQLAEDGTIVAGGSFVAAQAIAFIARTASAQALDDLVNGLPLATRAQTRVVPLTSFASRAKLASERLQRFKAQAAEPASAGNR